MTHALNEITAAEPIRWDDALAQAGRHDFYHTAAYHALAERRGEGRAVLLDWHKEGRRVALPLLVRPIHRIFALREVADGLCDATSVYGYAGPVGAELSPNLRIAFAKELRNWCEARRIVSLFSRLHPLLNGAQLVDHAGEIAPVGPTVAIELTAPEADQTAGYRSNHRRDLRKLRESGFACHLASSADGDAVCKFAALYRETMERVDAADAYMFDEAYFTALLAIPGLDLMLCMQHGEICAGAIISRCGEIAQYHLGGTHTRWLSHSPMKLIFDEARLAARDAGCHWLHLGGGLGAREDALFNFKAGFSPVRCTFSVWRWVVDEAAYAALIERAAAIASPGYFPAYEA